MYEYFMELDYYGKKVVRLAHAIKTFRAISDIDDRITVIESCEPFDRCRVEEPRWSSHLGIRINDELGPRFLYVLLDRQTPTGSRVCCLDSPLSSDRNRIWVSVPGRGLDVPTLNLPPSDGPTSTPNPLPSREKYGNRGYGFRKRGK